MTLDDVKQLVFERRVRQDGRLRAVDGGKPLPEPLRRTIEATDALAWCVERIEQLERDARDTSEAAQ